MGTKKIVVIGGGAAGFFAAVNTKLMHPTYEVCIIEKTNKLLSKVLISGGGRCNVTNHCFDNSQLIKNYPRGEKELQQVFSRFAVKDTINWFLKQGIALKTEPDGRMFPESNSSETIANCFLDLAEELKIPIFTQLEVTSITKTDHFHIKTGKKEFIADAVICSSGGHHKAEAYHFLKQLGHDIIEPIPSLFTINLPHENIKKELQGVSVKHAKVSIEGTKHFYEGPVLVTHWGLSGPAVLKLSAYAAKHFYDCGYKNTILINWTGHLKQNEITETLQQMKQTYSKSLVIKNPAFELPKRIWEFLLTKIKLDESINWANLSNTHLNKLSSLLFADSYKMEGKTTFKEEFVTAGGINLKEVDFKTMESKLVKGLHFCGEVLNIDGITGGFNFQAAWSTAFVCASSV